MFSSIFALLTNSHVLSAAAGAIATWGVNHFSTLMGWYATDVAAINKITGAKLPAALPTTVAQLKAALPTPANTPVFAVPGQASSSNLNYVSGIEKLATDVVADVKAL